MTWPIGPNLAPGWIAATIKEEGQTRGCDTQTLYLLYNYYLLLPRSRALDHVVICAAYINSLTHLLEEDTLEKGLTKLHNAESQS
ncbi:hypothetical protein O181_034996 [Austropuccinia psidii MF-1]|uniref:Uncharacterized protein n=1 Tax=Austropuccinia psidii MF-1 TaxID=1389203 RepID=A0A9Q3H8J6_9BASI|nr:hypothetical protein [Austropuccinia psidii MF-1]